MRRTPHIYTQSLPNRAHVSQQTAGSARHGSRTVSHSKFDTHSYLLRMLTCRFAHVYMSLCLSVSLFICVSKNAKYDYLRHLKPSNSNKGHQRVLHLFKPSKRDIHVKGSSYVFLVSCSFLYMFTAISCTLTRGHAQGAV